MLGAFLALLSAATFGFSDATVRRGVIAGSVLQALAITVPIGVPIFLIVAGLGGMLAEVFSFSTQSFWLLAIAGVSHFIIGRYTNYRALRAMGSNLTGILQQGILIVSLVLAVIFLGEQLTPLRLIGIALVIAGPALMLRGRRKAPETADNARTSATASATFTPNYVEGYVFGILNGLAFGSSPILIRAALDGTTIAAGVAGGLISYVAATIGVGLFLLLPGRIRHVRAMDGTAAKWFTISGVFVCISQMIRYMALALAPVAVVAPLQRTTIVFRLIFGWMLNRDHEVYGFWVFFGLGLAMVGALALTISTEFLLNVIAVPDWLAQLARWRWPT